MIQPSLFLRRAILADAIFSGLAALALSLGAGLLAPWLNLPEALLRETGLFLIAYTALVGWLGTRQSMPKALVVVVIAGNAAWTARQHRAAVLGMGQSQSARRDVGRHPGDRGRRLRGAAIHRPAQERRRGQRLSHDCIARTSAAAEAQGLAAARA